MPVHIENLACALLLSGGSGGAVEERTCAAAHQMLLKYRCSPEAGLRHIRSAIPSVESALVSQDEIDALLERLAEEFSLVEAELLAEIVSDMVYVAECNIGGTLYAPLEMARLCGADALAQAVYQRASTVRMNPIIYEEDGSLGLMRAITLKEIPAFVEELDREGQRIHGFAGVQGVRGTAHELVIRAQETSLGGRWWQGLVDGTNVEMDPSVGAAISAVYNTLQRLAD